MLASTGSIDLARILLDLLIIIGVARLAAEIAERLGIPAVLGEILAGVAVGPAALALVDPVGPRGVSLAVLAELGVLLLLVQVGMEMDLAELGRVGRASLAVAVLGVVVPFAAGAAVGLAFGESSDTAIFLGAALTATSVGITARVFGDLRALTTTEARIVLGAAVADDVIGLVVLTVVVKVVSGGSVGVGTVLGTFGVALAFLAVTGVVGVLGVPRLLDRTHRLASSPGTVTIVAVVVMLAFAELADAAHLAFIIGAFMAGLGIGRSTHHERVASDLGSIGGFLVPVFFVQIGVNTDVGVMTDPRVLGLAGALTVVAVLGKLAAAAGTFGTTVDRLVIGVGMIPRGEVGLIFAAIGLSNGVLDERQYGALIVVVLATTVLTPPVLRWRLRATPSSPEEGAAEAPSTGWLTDRHGDVDLAAIPPVASTARVVLQAAGWMDTHHPGPELLEWIGRNRSVALDWHPDITGDLIAVLRGSSPRAWRFLEATGVVERALPEVASNVARRRADAGVLDPLGVLRFPSVDRLLSEGPAEDAWVLAAFAADVCTDHDDPTRCASALLARLGHDAERVERLLVDALLLRSGLHATHTTDQRELLQLAAHLGTAAHTRGAHRVARSLGSLAEWQVELLDERIGLVLDALAHPEVTSGAADNVAAARRVAAQRLLDDPAAIERLQFADNTYLLAHEPDVLARHAQLVEPLPRSGMARVAVAPEPSPDRWRIDVACRDLDGLLARLTSALARLDLDVETADIATWPDGAVVDSFVVRSRFRPSARDLAAAFETAMRGRPPRPVPGDLDVEIDDRSLLWHTSVRVRGNDHVGALEAVAACFAAAGVQVHHATIGTIDGRIDDRFAVTDRLGRKLDGRGADRLRAVLETGATRRRRRRR